ncbi:MAG: hypothetical protein JNM56_02805 [Planctomycetia bacterium]|nr:hypothetical protein [Planctomycetia bacterium]
MDVQFKLLQESDSFRDALVKVLRRDGWKVRVAKPTATIAAKHPFVRDETMARERLVGLNLLTAPAMRIEFQKRAVAVS